MPQLRLTIHTLYNLMVAVWPRLFPPTAMGEVHKMNACSNIGYTTLLTAHGSVDPPEILEAAVSVVRWRGWCGDYRRGRSQLPHCPSQEDAPGPRSSQAWHHLGGRRELDKMQHSFSSVSSWCTHAYLASGTLASRPFPRRKSSKFKVQSVTLAGERTCSSLMQYSSTWSCTAVSQDHS